MTDYSILCGHTRADVPHVPYAQCYGRGLSASLHGEFAQTFPVHDSILRLRTFAKRGRAKSKSRMTSANHT
jgi:hypothetical protein